MSSQITWHKLDSPSAVGELAAKKIADCLLQKPNAVIAFPTGNTPLPMYRALRENLAINWQLSHLLHLDEYCMPESGEQMAFEFFADYLKRELLTVAQGTFYPIGNYVKTPGAYDELIKSLGGLDLVILGIGTNGHIAFNEPGTSPDSLTHCVSLSESTRLANFGTQYPPQHVPTKALSMGIQTILSAREIVLLATGLSKQFIVEHCFKTASKPDRLYPASWLKRHPCVTLLTDF
jgi:glucosamine-6-phosphate deaminase